MPELHLWQPRFTYSTCRKFPKYRERIQTFKLVIYRNELHKAWFAVYAGSKSKRIVSDKVLKDRAYEISLYHKYGGYQKWLASVVHKFLIRKQDREEEWQEKRK